MIALILCYLTRTEAIKSIKTMKHCFILKPNLKMKILLATTSHVSAILVKGQGAWLKSKGNEVIFSSSEGEKANAFVKEEKLIYEPINFSREINVINDFSCLVQCIKVLKKHKPDVVNAGTP